jgi:hypothetical protein
MPAGVACAQDTVRGFKAVEGHSEDILCMRALQERNLLATGDYGGRIHVCTLSSGERRCTLAHASHRCAAMATPGAACSHTCGSNAHVQATLFVFCSSLPALSTPAQAPDAVRTACRFESAVAALEWLPTAAALLLVSAGADGGVRVWRVALEGTLLATLDGALGALESVQGLCVDAERRHLLMCDSSGHVKVWDVSRVDAATPESTRASFVVVRRCACLWMDCASSAWLCMPVPSCSMHLKRCNSTRHSAESPACTRYTRLTSVTRRRSARTTVRARKL